MMDKRERDSEIMVTMMIDGGDDDNEAVAFESMDSSQRPERASATRRTCRRR